MPRFLARLTGNAPTPSPVDVLRLGGPPVDNAAIDEETGYHTKRILAIPVYNRLGHTIGVTEVLNRRDGDFTLADAAVLQAFTTHMATAIENAQLYEELLTR